MRSLDELLEESSTIHGHRCAGQILGVRMAMVGCREVGIDEPRGCKKLIVYAEIDRCATDAVQAVTGCSLGKSKRIINLMERQRKMGNHKRKN
jgi:formylmethanofuran dehydrogenase subunit E